MVRGMRGEVRPKSAKLGKRERRVRLTVEVLAQRWSSGLVETYDF